jgi:valyl-tRNA synthetase
MSTTDIPKQYDPKDAQDRWYEFWVKNGAFHADPSSDRKPYCIVIPPPNVTGALHLGHALNNTLQDILIRWRRMQGRDCLWMPGTDHAGIATQAVVERRLFEEEKKTRHDLGRQALVDRIWAWKDEYETRILSQLRLMGCSCDWDRTRFTLDEVCSKAVRRTFFNLFKAGKIFRGKRLVNWDTQLRTAVADDEIYTEDVPGHIWTIRYPVVDTTEVLHVATTRPETMLGDTAVAVHPEDGRYNHLIGKLVDLPLTERRIPIVADPVLVDPSFGTGCVKVTPAHDPNDYQAGVRNNLPMINLLNPDGTYNEHAGPKYAGLDRMVVRKRVLEDLKAQGLLERTDSHLVPLKHSDRSKTPIEPYLSDQWFVRMADDEDGTPGFAQQAIDAVESGRVKIHPERYAKSYVDWLAEKRDWCISRQLWWGHQIPVWSLAIPLDEDARRELRELDQAADRSGRHEDVRDGVRDWFRRLSRGMFEDSAFAEGVIIHVARSEPDPYAELRLLACVDSESPEAERRLEAEYGFVRDPDVLDTWFSSALWPHSTLGWPEQTPELARYYPTSVLSTARDIITLWVARMVIFGQFNMGDIPFRDVYIHPVIQDGKGKRMSKSAGNGVDPVDIIEIYGADALRYTLAAGATETQDLRIPVEKLKLADGRTINTSERFEQGRNFANKFWNVARFTMMNLEGYEPGPVALGELPYEDRWILAGLDEVVAATTDDLEAFRFADAARRLRDFIWGEFCDWYVEFVKTRLREPATRPTAQRVVASVLDTLCRLLHPVMPFLTEQIWQSLGQVAAIRGLPKPVPAGASICTAAWPVPLGLKDDEARATVAQWQEKVQAVRNLRAERNVPPAARVAPIILADGPIAERLRRGEAFLKSLTNADSVTITPKADRPAESVTTVLADAEVILPLEGLIDKEAECAKLRKSLAELDKQIGGLRAKLANEAFITRAPAEVVEAQRTKLAELEAQHAAVDALIQKDCKG